jgi:hypothetical protein
MQIVSMLLKGKEFCDFELGRNMTEFDLQYQKFTEQVSLIPAVFASSSPGELQDLFFDLSAPSIMLPFIITPIFPRSYFFPLFFFSPFCEKVKQTKVFRSRGCQHVYFFSLNAGFGIFTSCYRTENNRKNNSSLNIPIWPLYHRVVDISDTK